jgi:hypothetical protein
MGVPLSDGIHVIRRPRGSARHQETAKDEKKYPAHSENKLRAFAGSSAIRKSIFRFHREAKQPSPYELGCLLIVISAVD